MSNPNILTEIPPISPQDCFVVFDRYKREFCYPVHIHQEYELNLVCGARGATRIVGDSIREIGALDLVLITGSYLEHAWLNGNYACDADVHEVCIQFSPELFEKGFIDKKQFHPIRRMFEYAQRGIAFSEQTIVRAEPYFERLVSSGERFASVLHFLALLNFLACEGDYQILAQRSVSTEPDNYNSPRIRKVMQFLNENYRRDIPLAEVTALVNMSEPTFRRFIKQHTGKSFVTLLNDIRLGAASRLLIESPTKNISEVAYMSGFNNLSNFNRIFRRCKGMTPRDFKTYYSQKKINV